MREDTPSFMGPAIFFGLIIFVLAFEEAGPIYLNPQETMDLSEATGPMEQDRLAVSMPRLILAKDDPEAVTAAVLTLPTLAGGQFVEAEAFTRLGWTQTPEGFSWRLTNFARLAEIGPLPKAMPAVLHQGPEVAANTQPILTAAAPRAAAAEPDFAALPASRLTVAGLFEAPSLTGAESRALGEGIAPQADPGAGTAGATTPLGVLEPEALPQSPTEQGLIDVDDQAPGLEPRANPTALSGNPGQGWTAPAQMSPLGGPVLAPRGAAPIHRPTDAAVTVQLEAEDPELPTLGTDPGSFSAETVPTTHRRPSPAEAAPQDNSARYTPLLWRTVTGNYVNVRTAPSLEAEVILQIFVGFRVILIEPGPEFSLVNWPDRETPFTGWISNDYLSVD